MRGCVGLDRWTRKLSVAVLAVLGVLALSAPVAAAADFTFVGGHSSGNWSDGANWAGGTAPAGTVGTLNFPASSCSSTLCPASNDDISGLTASTLSIVAPSTMPPTPPPSGWYLQDSGAVPLTLNSGLNVSLSQIGSVADPGTVIAIPITLGAANTWAVNEANVTLIANVSGNQSLALNLSNSGSLFFQGASNEVGPITATGTGVCCGSLDVQSDLNGTNGHAVALSGARLGGKGTVGAVTTSNSASVTPGVGGPPTGSLSVTSATLDTTSQAQFNVAGTGTVAGTDYPQLTSSGAINLASTRLSIQAGFPGSCLTPAVGNVYTLVTTTGSLTGAFSNAADGTVITDSCNNSYRINYTAHAVTATVVTGGGGTPTTTALS